MSAVSNNVMPAPLAASTTACVRSASIRIPKLLHPSPTSETVRSPICLDSIFWTLGRTDTFFLRDPVRVGSGAVARAAGEPGPAQRGDRPVALVDRQGGRGGRGPPAEVPSQ